MAISKGCRSARGHPLNRELLTKTMGYVRPDRAWRLLRRASEREQKRVVVSVLDQLRDQRVRTLLLLGDGEPLLAQFDRPGAEAARLPEWPRMVLDHPPSADHVPGAVAAAPRLRRATPAWTSRGQGQRPAGRARGTG